MNDIRQVRRVARRQLHEALRLAAVYIAPDGTPSPTVIGVRLHGRTEPVGEIRAQGFAERLEDVTRAIFWLEEVTPERGAIISLLPGEAYEVEAIGPTDDQTVTAEVARLSKNQTEGLPVPAEPL